MASPDYNPNYEERRGRYLPAGAPGRLQSEGQNDGDRQNTASPAAGAEPERQQDDEAAGRFAEED